MSIEEQPKLSLELGQVIQINAPTNAKIDQHIYFIDYLPVALDYCKAIIFISSMNIISIICSLIPAYNILRSSPMTMFETK